MNNGVSIPRVAVSAAIVDNGRILLVQRGAEPNKGLWSLPGGAIELGENLKDALVREVAEETSLIVKPGELITVHEVIARKGGKVQHHYVIIVFSATQVGGCAKAGSDAVDLGWHTISDVQNMPITPGLREVIGHIPGLR